MRSTRFISTGLGAVLALALTPALAAAASPLVDDSATDFSAGTLDSSTWIVEPGSVRIKPAELNQNFDGGPDLPGGWSQGPWDPSTAVSTLGGGALTVDGSHVNTNDPTMSAPHTLEFRATFGNALFQNVGLGDTFENGPWAMFSTGDGSAEMPLGGLYARTLNAQVLGGTQTSTPLAVADPLAAHTYRIVWTTTKVEFWVDGVLKASPDLSAAPIVGQMRPVVSDLTQGGPTVKVDWLAAGDSFPSAGTFTSRVLDAGDAHTIWGDVTATGDGAATIMTRSGATPTPDGSWSAFQAVGPGNAIQSPAGRYIQYEALLGDRQSVDSVSIPYTIDNDAPAASISGVQVSGTTATVSFGSSANDVARFECSLDGGAFAECTSPKQFAGLAVGAHSVAVQATDDLGNVGNPASSSFSVEAAAATAAPAPTSTGQQTTAAVVDTSAPKVSFKALSSRVSKTGTLKVRVGCPAGESSCKVGVVLRQGRRSIAKKTVTVTGGKTATVSLRLTKAARRELAKRGRLKIAAVITAIDAAHNVSTATVKLTLRAPSAR